ncbi:MAG TPA: tetratricopeptide repeat-containing protein [Thermoanaerobaculia bacterium]|nr:tetratricopeptide repeat-containing protein [Thermoanaerobaculia bacterium]
MEPTETAGQAQQLRQICFMVMPFGVKETLAPPEKAAPAKINFNSLWEKAFAPAIRALGYDAVRADEDAGALIIHEMIERLAISDLVIADLTIPNANVYYEIGIRHAARKNGCVLVSADWSVPVFDVNQLRRITFPLPEGDVSDETAAKIQEALKAGILGLRDGETPPYTILPNFPTPDPEKAQSFKDLMQKLSAFQAEVTAVRRAPKDQCAAKARALLQRYATDAPMLSSVAMELLYLLRDCTEDWKAVIEYVDRLPKGIRGLPTVQEQRALALSKMGSPLEAAAALEAMINTLGPTSEREGLLGGRYKKLYTEAMKRGDARDAARYLDLAIEHYDLGMKLDLNDYYPTSNLARLLRTRAEEGDEDRAKAAAFVTLAACERAKARNPKDEWLNPTLLGAAFDSGDAAVAERLYKQILKEDLANWKLDTTIQDLETSIELQQDAGIQEKLTAILERLKTLLPR